MFVYLPPCLAPLLSSLLPPLLHPSHPPSFFPCAVQFLDSEQINRGRRRVGGGREVFMWRICSFTVTVEKKSARKEARRKAEVEEKMVFSRRDHTDGLLWANYVPFPLKKDTHKLKHSKTLTRHHTHMHQQKQKKCSFSWQHEQWRAVVLSACNYFVRKTLLHWHTILSRQLHQVSFIDLHISFSILHQCNAPSLHLTV